MSESPPSAPSGSSSPGDAAAEVPSPPTDPLPADAERGPDEPPTETPPVDVPMVPPVAGPPVATPVEVQATEDGDAAGSPAPRRKLRNWQLIALTLVAVGFLVVAYVLGRDSGTKTDDFTTFTDPKTGISLDYPKDWQVIESGDAEQRFVATPGGDSSVSVRVTDVGFSVAAADIPDAKTYTEQLLADKGLTLIRQQDITLNGAPTFYYLYSFKDSATGIEGVHAHYFVFHGQQMSQLVFQALPTSGFEKLVPTFARIAQSFTTPRTPQPSGASTTTPGADTSVPATSAPSTAAPPTSTP